MDAQIIGGPLSGHYPLIHDPAITVRPTWKTGAVGTCVAPGLTFACTPSGWILAGATSQVSPVTVNCGSQYFLFVGLDLTPCGGQSSETIVVTL